MLNAFALNRMCEIDEMEFHRLNFYWIKIMVFDGHSLVVDGGRTIW